MKMQAIPYLLIILMLFQSCVAYHKSSIPISDAQDRGKVKVVTKRGTNYEFKNIEYKDDAYYGNTKDDIVLIDTASISAIYLKNVKKSNWQTIILSVSVGLVLFFLVALIALSSGADEIEGFISLFGN